jgi:hypothetical protein
LKSLKNAQTVNYCAFAEAVRRLPMATRIAHIQAIRNAGKRHQLKWDKREGT